MKITFSNSIKSLDEEAFSNCLSLQQIIIPKESTERFKKMLDKELWDKLVEVK